MKEPDLFFVVDDAEGRDFIQARRMRSRFPRWWTSFRTPSCHLFAMPRCLDGSSDRWSMVTTTSVSTSERRRGWGYAMVQALFCTKAMAPWDF